MKEKILTCWGLVDPALFERFKPLKLAVFDVDGTLTDGGVYLDGQQGELKKFTTKDGLGLNQLNRSGVRCAVITGRNSPIVARRMAELKIDLVLQGISDKSAALKDLMTRLQVSTNEVITMGDDLNDLPMFKEAGITACPADAHPYICQTADVVLSRNGGCGAARELSDLILMAQGKLSLQGGYC